MQRSHQPHHESNSTIGNYLGVVIKWLSANFPRELVVESFNPRECRNCILLLMCFLNIS